MSARRALWRWSWRVLWRERRQQALVVGLVALAVTAGCYVALAAYHLGVSESSRWGSATHQLVMWQEPGGPSLDELIDAAADELGPVDVTRISSVETSWSPSSVDLRDEQLEPRFGRRPLASIEVGSRPDERGEVAILEDVAATLGLDVGDEVELGGDRYTISGLIDYPGLVAGELALVAPGSIDADQVEVLVQADAAAVEAFAASPERSTVVGVRPVAAETADTRAILLVGGYAVIALVMLEVTLLAAAGFAVIGRRRLAQFGVLAAVGASDRHLRQAMVGNGLAVGLAGSVIGTVCGVSVYLASGPWLEDLLATPIDGLAGAWVVAPTVGLGVVSAAAAAWWPARAVSRQPVVDALAARRPRPLPAGRSAATGVVAAVGGGVVLSLGIGGANAALAIVGLLLAVVGILLLAPVAVRLVGAGAAWLPLGARIAARELARHQGRTAAAVASLVVVLGVPAALAVTTAAADARGLDGEPRNLDPAMVVIRPGSADGAGFHLVPSRDNPAADRRLADRLADVLGPASVVAEIQIALDPATESTISGPGAPADAEVVLPVSALRAHGGEGSYSLHTAWVATPQLLEALGLPAQLASSPADLLTRHDEPTYLQLPEGQDDPAGATRTVEVELPLLATVADDLLTPAAVERRGYDVRTVGWLGVAAQPLTDGQRAAALALVASRDGVDVELPLPPGSTEGFRTVAAIVGSLLGLAIMAVVVALVRSESAAELRSLAAVGGSGRTRRSISAASAGLLALMGAVLALPGGYLALVALEAEPNADYPFVVPWVSLGMLVVAVPVLAMGGAWLAGGREPETLLRTPLG